jgi:hypothetical protein
LFDFERDFVVKNVDLIHCVGVANTPVTTIFPTIKINCIDYQGVTINNFTFKAWKESFFCSVPGRTGGADLGATSVTLYSPTPLYVEKRF